MPGDFSTLALSFAHELQMQSKVPDGVLLTSHSNTRIEAFAGPIDERFFMDGNKAIVSFEKQRLFG